MSLRFGSVCSGIEAASVAWEPLGWRAAWFSEIESFPSAVLAHHYPATPNHGDMTTLPGRIRAGDVEAPDLLCGGTPCQAFSVAGLRRSLDDARGNLTLTFVEIADAIDAVRLGRGQDRAVIFWENVPGVLNTPDNAFGCFLGALAGEDCALKPAGRRWTDAGCVLGPTRAVAWRVLDAQHFGLAQRRRRVFVVAGARDRFDPTESLFEREGVLGIRSPRREEEGSGKPASAFARSDEVDSGVLCREHGTDWDECGCWCIEDMICPWCDEWTSGLHYDPALDGLSCCGAWVARLSNALTDGAHMGGGLNGQDASSGRILVDNQGRVRRLTVRECERLQGFPDDYSKIAYRNRPAEDCPDGPRYRALGNSWAVPVVRWIGARIDAALRSTP